MSTIVNHNKKSINIEDINVQLTCRACGKSYNVRMRKPQQMKNCNCGNATFYISIIPMRGRLLVSVLEQHLAGEKEEIEPDSVEVEER